MVVAQPGIAAFVRRTALAPLVAAALATGCGGGGTGNSTSSSGSTSPAQFRSQVAQICRQAQKKIDALPKPTSVSEINTYLDKTLAIARPYVDKLAAVKPPDQFSAQYQQIVSLNRQELALVTETKSALSGGGNPLKVVRKFQQQASSLSSSEDAKWRQIGVPQCAS